MQARKSENLAAPDILSRLIENCIVTESGWSKLIFRETARALYLDQQSFRIFTPDKYALASEYIVSNTNLTADAGMGDVPINDLAINHGIDFVMIVPYCERLSNGMEPLNTASNLAFLLAVAYSLPTWLRLNSSKHPVPMPQTLRHAMNIVVMLPVFIGIGSSFFHATPTTITHMLDLGPICLFVILTTVIFLALSNRSPATIAILLLVWITTTAIAAQWPEVLAHSLFYLPTVGLLFFLLASVKGSDANHSTRRRLLLATSRLVKLAHTQSGIC